MHAFLQTGSVKIVSNLVLFFVDIAQGGFEFKKAITDCIVELMVQIPETKETSLFHLCDFIGMYCICLMLVVYVTNDNDMYLSVYRYCAVV
jgi:hypothetical protein